MNQRRKVRSAKDNGDYENINRDLFEIILNYKRYTTKKEWQFYIILPLLLSTIVFIFIGFFEPYNMGILNSILDINQTSLTVIAILAGFNTTSLSIIAASNNKVLRYLQNVKLKKDSENGSVLKQIISFFSFAIIFQLIILVIGLFLSMISKNLKEFSELFSFLNGLAVRIPLSILGVLWLSAILFALIISVRNATLLYRYVLFIADYKDENDVA